MGGEDPLEKEVATHFSILAWKIHGERSLVGYSPWSLKELDRTQHTHTHILNAKYYRECQKESDIFVLL